MGRLTASNEGAEGKRQILRLFVVRGVWSADRQSGGASRSSKMRTRLAVIVAALVCWMVVGASAQRVPRPGTRPDDRPVFAVPTDEKASEAPREMEAASALDTSKKQHAAVVAVGAAKGEVEQDESPVVTAGRAPVVVLVAGAAVIGVVALAFQTRRSGKKERDESDPMQQSLLYHDMDYAAM